MPGASFRRVHAFHTTSVLCQILLFDERGQSVILTSFYGDGGNEVSKNMKRWKKLAEREGVDYAKTVAEMAGLKGFSADKEVDRKEFRRQILERVLKFKKG